MHSLLINGWQNDQFQQECFSFVAESTKILYYRILKNNFQFEKYFSVLPYKFIYTLSEEGQKISEG